MSVPAAVAAVLLVASVGPVVRAEQTPGLTSAAPGILTVEPTAAAPDLDGRLQDELWQTATRITRFVQQRPIEGQPATEDTEVYLAYDRDHIYVGIRALYSDARLIRANRVDRDQIWQDDTVRLLFDPFLDQQRAYVFSVNGYGIQGDTLLSAGGGGGRGRGGGGGGGQGGGGGGGFPPGDASWNALFSSAGVVGQTGWTAELAIPFKSLRYPARAPGELHHWGFQVQRTIESKNETVVWAPVTRSIQGLLRQMGRLEGLRDLSTSRNLEIQPTLTAVHTAALDESTGAFSSDHAEEGGVNVTYGITSNLTASFTANPDFSQVESDRPQIETNQRFPLFIPEQRPFFVEGQDAFDVQAPVTVLHTRTIVDPRYGAKVTGTLGRAIVGLLVADDQAPGRLESAGLPGFGASAQVLVGRARYVLAGDSSIGAIVTNREFAETFSRLAGVDGQVRIGEGYRVRFGLMTAHHRDAEGIERRGETYQVEADRQGRSFDITVAHAVVDPDFRTDLGFVRRTDTRETSLRASYTFWPESWISSWGPRLRAERVHDAAGVLQNNDLSAGLNVQFASNISMNADINRNLERFEDVEFETTRFSAGGSVNMSRRVALRGNVSTGRRIRFVENPFLGDATNLNVTVDLRPASRLHAEISLTTSRLVDPRSGVEEFDVRILRARTTYQFTNRMLARGIVEYDTGDRTMGLNLLATYRVNAGTALFVGYDDHYEAWLAPLDPPGGPRRWRRSNRALFTKLQVLLRY